MSVFKNRCIKSSLLETSDDVCAHPVTLCSPYNVGVLIEEYTGPLSPVSYELWLCATLTAAEKQSSKTTGSSGQWSSQTAQPGMLSLSTDPLIRFEWDGKQHDI